MNVRALNPQRQCVTNQGIPKLAFATFDEAMDVVARQHGEKRTHAYRCDEHGWHLGHNMPVWL